jgi:hypothetical protein
LINDDDDDDDDDGVGLIRLDISSCTEKNREELPFGERGHEPDGRSRRWER